MSPESQSNQHHLFYPRRHYKTPAERKLRRHPLLVVRMLVPRHKDLHAILNPPRKLPGQDIHYALDVLGDMEEDDVPQVDAVAELASSLDKRSETCRIVAKNLLHQVVYL